MPNPYQILGVTPAASVEAIKSAYRRKLRKNHPDLNAEPDAVAKTRAIVEAWQILSDPKKRTQLDLALGQNKKAPKPAQRKKCRTDQKTRGTPNKNSRRTGQRQTKEWVHTHATFRQTQTIMFETGTSAMSTEDIVLRDGTHYQTILGDLIYHGPDAVTVKGSIMGDIIATSGGELHIIGSVMGDIRSTNLELHIKGSVLGDLRAKGGRIHISGHVMGNMQTENTVVLGWQS